jgi:hypothetical protein
MMKTITIEEARAIYKVCAKRYSDDDVAKAARTEIHAALQLANPPPYSDVPVHLAKKAALSHDERQVVLEHQRSKPTDEECIDFARNRGSQPHVVDAHHWVQLKHGTSLWEEADRIMALLEQGEQS